MGHQETFDDILKKKMKRNFSTEASQEFTDPAFTTFVWTSTPKFENTAPQSRVNRYNVWKKNNTQPRPSSTVQSAPQPEEPVFSTEELSKLAREAREELIQSFGAQELNFSELSLSTLKKCYRRLAKKLHPDLHPNIDALAFPRMRHLHKQIEKEAQSLITPTESAGT